MSNLHFVSNTEGLVQEEFFYKKKLKEGTGLMTALFKQTNMESEESKDSRMKSGQFVLNQYNKVILRSTLTLGFITKESPKSGF